MSNVTIAIAGRRYTIACAPGEEEHIKMLGASIDGKLAKLDNLSGQSEARLLLYAALLLADEAHEANLRASRSDDDSAELFERLAARMESVATRLESESVSS